MSDENKSESHVARGRKGGKRTAKLYGKEHMAEIGKKGADRVAEILKAGKRALAGVKGKP